MCLPGSGVWSFGVVEVAVPLSRAWAAPLVATVEELGDDGREVETLESTEETMDKLSWRSSRLGGSEVFSLKWA